MSRSRSPLGVEVDPPAERAESSTDLKSVLSSLFDETESRNSRELIAEVDALVAGVVRDLHQEVPVALPPADPARREASLERVARSAPWRTSAPIPFKRPAPAIVPVTRRPSAPRFEARYVLGLGLAGAVVAIGTLGWVLTGAVPSMSGGGPDGSAPSPAPAVTLPAPAVSLPPALTPSAAVPAGNEPVASPEPEAPSRPAASPPPSSSSSSPRRPSDVGRATSPQTNNRGANAAPVTPLPAPAPAPSPTSASVTEPPRTVAVEPVGDAATAPADAATRLPAPSAPAVEARTSVPPASASPAAATVDAAPPTVEPGVSVSTPALPSGSGSPDKRDARVVKRVMPHYPPQLLAARVGGVVRLGISVDAQGRVTNVQTTGAHELLRREAALAAGQWQYEPATDAGVPVDSQVVVYLSFDPQQGRRRP